MHNLWIMILVIHWGYGTTSQQSAFLTKEACVAAGKTIETNWHNGFGITADYICFESDH